MESRVAPTLAVGKELTRHRHSTWDRVTGSVVYSYILSIRVNTLTNTYASSNCMLGRLAEKPRPGVNSGALMFGGVEEKKAGALTLKPPCSGVTIGIALLSEGGGTIRFPRPAPKPFPSLSGPLAMIPSPSCPTVLDRERGNSLSLVGRCSPLGTGGSYFFFSFFWSHHSCSSSAILTAPSPRL